MIKIDSKPPIEVKLPEGAMNVTYGKEEITYTFNTEKFRVKVEKVKPRKNGTTN
jgi:hypothetical protein